MLQIEFSNSGDFETRHNSKNSVSNSRVQNNVIFLNPILSKRSENFATAILSISRTQIEMGCCEFPFRILSMWGMDVMSLSSGGLRDGVKDNLWK